jgi:hypothetical protein
MLYYSCFFSFLDRFVTKSKQVSGNHQFDKLCSLSEIEHRLTKPATPKTNGMVERVNGTIKNATVKATTYQNIDGMKRDLNQFLIFYNFNRGHGGLRKEIKAMIKELNGIGSGFIVIDFKIKHSGGTVNGNWVDKLT